MTTARFRLELPEQTWIKDLSRSHPDAQFRLLTGIPVEDGALELGEIRADDPASVVESFEQQPAIHRYEGLYTQADRALARYVTTDTSLYDFLQATSFPPEFPIVVQDGSVELDLTAPRDRLQAITDTLRASGLDFEVLSVVDTETPVDLLTERQREVLETAVALGYYSVPRDCTLTELATQLGVDKSTASGVLRRAEARIVTWFLSAVTHDFQT